MAGRSVESALFNALQNLAQDDLNRFIHELWVREEEPRIPRRKVEGKDDFTVANVMVSTLNERNAVNVAVEILNRIGCSKEAEKLVKTTGGHTSQSASTDVSVCTVKKTGGHTSQSAYTDDMHFVDKHRVALIQRVNNIVSVLDDLLKEEIINPEAYDKIQAMATRQDKMRELYGGPLKAGKKSKEIFYQILQKHEKFLIEDLQG